MTIRETCGDFEGMRHLCKNVSGLMRKTAEMHHTRILQYPNDLAGDSVSASSKVEVIVEEARLFQFIVSIRVRQA